MPYDQAGGGGEDMYSDAPKTDAAPKPDADKKDEGGKIYLLPEEVLEGKKFDVGDELVLKIVAKHDGQISVQYAPSKDQEEEMGEGEGKEGMAPEASAGAPPGGGAGDMASMME